MGLFRDQNERANGSLIIGAFESNAECRMWNAESKSFDLGTHGKGLLEQTFLGSVAHSVLDRAKKPVFIVPLPHEETGLTIGEI